VWAHWTVERSEERRKRILPWPPATTAELRLWRDLEATHESSMHNCHHRREVEFEDDDLPPSMHHHLRIWDDQREKLPPLSSSNSY
jgi:hypothetical protein